MPGFVLHEMEPELGPPRPAECIEGLDSHEWRLSIEEGQVTLSCDCTLCEYGLNNIIGPELDSIYEMQPIAVRLGIEHDPGNPPYGIDPYVWIQISPIEDP